MDKRLEFLFELKALLERYGASIGHSYDSDDLEVRFKDERAVYLASNVLSIDEADWAINDITEDPDL